MSRKKKKKFHKPQNLKRTAQQKMNSINRIGVSKKETCEKLGVKVSPFIHSASTFNQYSGISRRYAEFCEETDPTATTLRYCFKQGYARAFVQAQIDAGLSPSTIARTTCALAKLHSVTCPEIHESRPRKRYADYTRARHYDEAAYAKDAARIDERGATTRFLRACGIREFELTNLYGNLSIPPGAAVQAAPAFFDGNGLERLMDGYRDMIKSNIEYDILSQRRNIDVGVMDELVELMVCTLINQTELVRIGSQEYPYSYVKKRLLGMDSSHMEYVLESFSKNTSKVHNIRAYLLTTLFNAPGTIESSYAAEVRHDLYGT